jgi:hypothetical protein
MFVEIYVVKAYFVENWYNASAVRYKLLEFTLQPELCNQVSKVRKPKLNLLKCLFSGSSCLARLQRDQPKFAVWRCSYSAVGQDFDNRWRS